MTLETFMTEVTFHQTIKKCAVCPNKRRFAQKMGGKFVLLCKAGAPLLSFGNF